jgi:hypothetical protein
MITFDQSHWGRQYGKFRDTIDQYIKLVGRDSLDLLKQQSILLCTDMATVTQPYTNSTKSKKLGENAVSRDINKVFRGPKKMYDRIKKESEDVAKGFWSLYKSGKFKDAEELFYKATGERVQEITKTPHIKARNKRGRVTDSSADINAVYHVKSDDRIKAYAGKIQKRVGFAKSGWITAAEQIGTIKKRVPAWIKRHKNTQTGSARLHDVKGTKYYLITNKVRYIKEIFNSGSFMKASSFRIKAMQREIKKILEHRGKKVQ